MCLYEYEEVEIDEVIAYKLMLVTPIEEMQEYDKTSIKYKPHEPSEDTPGSLYAPVSYKLGVWYKARETMTKRQLRRMACDERYNRGFHAYRKLPDWCIGKDLMFYKVKLRGVFGEGMQYGRGDITYVADRMQIIEKVNYSRGF